MPTIEFIVDVDEAGRLDRVVAARTGLSRAVAAKLIGAGAVTVGGSAAAKSVVPPAGAVIRVELPEEEEPPAPEDLPIAVVYEDDAILVVDKPAGMVVHPAPGHASGTLVNALLARGAAGGDPARPGIVHRLDAGTSGLMIVAKGEVPYEALVEAMKGRRIRRRYAALIEGSPDTETFTVDAPIGRSPVHRKKMAVVASGKPARTQVAVRERLARATLVEVSPETGRTHQIRVHLATAGHPVVGDRVYGRDRRLGRALGLERPFLHAEALVFAHPVSRRSMSMEAPLPADLADALAAARRS